MKQPTFPASRCRVPASEAWGSSRARSAGPPRPPGRSPATTPMSLRTAPPRYPPRAMRRARPRSLSRSSPALSSQRGLPGRTSDREPRGRPLRIGPCPAPQWRGRRPAFRRSRSLTVACGPNRGLARVDPGQFPRPAGVREPRGDSDLYQAPLLRQARGHRRVNDGHGRGRMGHPRDPRPGASGAAALATYRPAEARCTQPTATRPNEVCPGPLAVTGEGR